MGASASIQTVKLNANKEATMPLDGMDVKDLDGAKMELIRLRQTLHFHRLVNVLYIINIYQLTSFFVAINPSLDITLI